jgi:hypothetical protein
MNRRYFVCILTIQYGSGFDLVFVTRCNTQYAYRPTGETGETNFGGKKCKFSATVRARDTNFTLGERAPLQERFLIVDTSVWAEVSAEIWW